MKAYMGKSGFRVGVGINKKNNYRLLFAGLVLIMIAAVALPLYYFRPSVIPKAIVSKVTFPIFYPEKSKQLTYQANTIKYDASLGQVSFIVNYLGHNITFSEQGSPDSFAASPTFYTSFIEKLNGYATFDGIYGRVDLTDPTQINSETAVMNDKGTLMFARSNGNLSQNQWKLLINSMNYTQPK